MLSYAVGQAPLGQWALHLQHPLAGKAPFQNEMGGEILIKLIQFAALD